MWCGRSWGGGPWNGQGFRPWSQGVLKKKFDEVRPMEKMDLEGAGSLLCGMWVGKVQQWVWKDPGRRAEMLSLHLSIRESARAGDEAAFNEAVRALKKQRSAWEAEYRNLFPSIKVLEASGSFITFSNPGTDEFKVKEGKEDE